MRQTPDIVRGNVIFLYSYILCLHIWQFGVCVHVCEQSVWIHLRKNKERRWHWHKQPWQVAKQMALFLPSFPFP